MRAEQSLDDHLEDARHAYLEFCGLNGISRPKQVAVDQFRERRGRGFPVNLLLLVQTPRNYVPEETDYSPAEFAAQEW